MNFRTTFIIIVLLAAVAGAYFLFFQQQEDKAAEDEKLRLHQVYSLPQQNVQQIRLSFADEASYQPLTLTKNTEGAWQLTQPVPADADDQKVNELLDNFLNKRIKQTLEVKELEQYGLDIPNITASLWTDLTVSPKTFLIGKKAINFSVYCKEKSESHIFLIESSALDDLTKAPADLRDKTAVKFNPKAVSELRVVNDNAEALRCEKTGNTWTMTHPFSAKADIQEIETIFSALSSLQISTFEADDTINGQNWKYTLKEKYGLQPPQLSVILKAREGTFGLQIGSPVPGNKNQLRYVKPIHQNSVYTVVDNIYAQLNKTAFDLRDKRILDFQRTDTIRFEIQLQSTTTAHGMEKIVSVKNYDDTWLLTREPGNSSSQIKADATAVDELLFGVDSLKAVEFVDNPVKNLASYGLDTPRIRVSFTQRGEEASAVLLIGRYQGETVYVKSHDTVQISLVNRALIDKIATGVAWLRNKQILDFSIDDVNRLELKYEDVSLICQRLATNWRLISPVREDANNAEVNAIIYELDDLKVEEFLPVVPDAATTGFNSPQIQITVGLRNQQTYTLQIGSPEAPLKTTSDDASSEINTSARFYARLGHEPHVAFLLDAPLIPKLKTTLERLRSSDF